MTAASKGHRNSVRMLKLRREREKEGVKCLFLEIREMLILFTYHNLSLDASENIYEIYHVLLLIAKL